VSFAQKLLSEPQADPYLTGFDTAFDRVLNYRRAYRKHREVLRPTLDAFKVLGAGVEVDLHGSINVQISGDKDCFVKCWKLWRELGIRLDPPEKGATQISQVHEWNGLRFWFWFTSTVCKRVAIGTKMVPQTIYETQCGEGLPTLDDNSIDLPSITGTIS
jgi:hypothetical protein